MKLQNQLLLYYLPLITLLLFLQLTLSLPICAQLPPATDSFNKKDYADYLTYLEKEFSVTPLSKLSYETIARSAVAIEKTNRWEAMSGKQARELLKESPDALRYLEATRLLLKEEPAGLDKLIQGALPAPSALMRVSSMLREHGYEFAGNAIGVLAPDLPRQGAFSIWRAFPRSCVRQSVRLCWPMSKTRPTA